jgi:hypothetical protein
MRTLYYVLSCFLALVSASACTQTPASAQPPFKTPHSVLEIMEGPLGHAAEVYWDSVSTVVDKDGVHENFPTTDEQWEAVWAAAITISESGNLLMMSPRAKDDGDWMKWSAQLVDVGVEARKAAESKNPEKVLELGEQVYNVCTACHMQYIMGDEE